MCTLAACQFSVSGENRSNLEFGTPMEAAPPRHAQYQCTLILSRLTSWIFCLVNSRCVSPSSLSGVTKKGNYCTYIFSCDQAALRTVISVCLPVCPSVRLSVTPFSQCSSRRIIMKFSGVIANDRSDAHAKGQGQRSKVKVTEVMTSFSRFRTVTPVWIHQWLWNDA